MDRRSFLSTLALGGSALVLGGRAQSQGYLTDTYSPYPYHVLPPVSEIDVLPPTAGAQPWDPYDPYATYDPYAPTQESVKTLKLPRWEKFFDSPKNGMIVCSVEHRVVHFRSENGKTQKAYLSSVPRSAEYTRTGRTTITMKRLNPTWVPTPDMRQADPNLPAKVGPGPDNPLGTRALNLGWPYYRIHGIDRPEKVGQPVSSGCFGLYNHAIEELYELVVVGTQVVVV